MAHNSDHATCFISLKEVGADVKAVNLLKETLAKTFSRTEVLDTVLEQFEIKN